MNNDLIHVNTLPPFKRMCMTIGELPTSYLESMTYYETLVWLLNYLEKTIIPTINNNGEAVIELQEKYIELKNYVDNYFDNLDVQEEINNKLDDMAEAGELTDIIAQYLGLAGVLAFDTVSDMKTAENLVNGSITKTLGYYSVNDGGNASYKIRTITNDDIVDEMFIIALHDNSLIAELIIENGCVNVKQLGVKSDTDSNNNATLFNNAITAGKCSNFFIPKGRYYFNNSITLSGRVNIRGNFDYDYMLDYSDNYIEFTNSDGFTGLDKNIIEGLCIKGDSTHTCFTRGNGNSPFISKCCIFDFGKGIDGNSKAVNVINSIIADCDYGIYQVTDAEISNCIIKTCTTGIYLDGMGDNRIINNRIEWNDEYGINISYGWHQVITNNLFDRNGYNAIKIANCPNSNINSNLFRRNYAKGNLQDDSSFAHLYVTSCNKINICNNMTDVNHIIDGDNTSNLEPAHSLYMIGSHYINLIGNDFTGCRGRNIVYDNYQKRVSIEDSTLSYDNTYYSITSGNSQTYDLNLPYIPATGLVPSCIKLIISYRAVDNSFYKIIEKNIAFMNDNNTIKSETYTNTEDNITITSLGITNKKLQISVQNASSTTLRCCISHKILLPPYTSSYEENNYTV